MSSTPNTPIFSVCFFLSFFPFKLLDFFFFFAIVTFVSLVSHNAIPIVRVLPMPPSPDIFSRVLHVMLREVQRRRKIKE